MQCHVDFIGDMVKYAFYKYMPQLGPQHSTNLFLFRLSQLKYQKRGLIVHLIRPLHPAIVLCPRGIHGRHTIAQTFSGTGTAVHIPPITPKTVFIGTDVRELLEGHPIFQNENLIARLEELGLADCYCSVGQSHKRM
jgi:hypothetical protein